MNPLGETRPGWKVLRVLGSLLGRRGVEFDTIEEVRAACLAGKDPKKLLSNEIGDVSAAASPRGGIERIADVPMYFADPLVRRSPPLQKTKESQPPRAWMSSRMLQRLGHLQDDVDGLEHPVDALRRLGPVLANDVLVETLAAAHAEEEPAGHEAADGRRSLGDDRRMEAHDRAGDPCTHAQRPGRRRDAAQHRPNERRAALPVGPWVVVV